MIPIKLKVRNFMCYRDNVPLSLEGIHMVCLSGENGSGKSALIDAMTWALWGKARAKSDDDLIHTTQREMEVEFDFKVGQQLYRIIRKRARPSRPGGQGKSSLDLFIASDSTFKPISGDSMTQTQQKIINALHMDYETFVNSAYLRQGHADEFTARAPAKRKEVLANILQLSRYDELAEQAKELAKQKELEKVQLEISIKEIDGELSQKPAYQAEFDRAQSELAQIEGEVREKEARLNQLRQEKEALEKKKGQLDQLEVSTRDKEKNLKLLEEESQQHIARINEYEALIAQRATIEEKYTQLTEARRVNEEFNRKLGILYRLKESKNRLEKVIDSAQANLVKEHALIQRNITELEAKVQKLPQLKGDLQLCQTKLSQLAEEEVVLLQKKQTGQELQAEISRLASDQNRLEQEIKEIEEKLHLLSTQTEAKCPLCESELGAEGLKVITSKYNAERGSKFDALQSNRVILRQKKQELETLEIQTSQLEAQISQEKASAQRKVAVLEKEINEAEDAERKLAEERKNLTEIEQHLARKEFALAEQRALAELESELVRLDYHPDEHEKLRQQLSQLEPYENRKRELEKADALINQEKEARARAEQSAQELRHSLKMDNQKREELISALVSLSGLVSEIRQVEIEQQELSARQKQASEAVGNVRAKLQRCAELEVKRKEKQQLVTQAAKEKDIYQELVEAFGKKGVQALLIETALPEIEAEANRLLSRMTDNRMHVKFESQRPTKEGDTIETLDINIADELGTRNYEMFSGGEAFRINFAIRIALSKLLARRAGAPLRTLIIDEGFGTQDSTGIDKLKEAINSVQDDFDRIIVITHMEELRDAFPTRIDVTKTAEGSTLSVS